MKQKLIRSLTRRMDEELSTKNPLRYLKDHNIEDYIDNLLSVVYLYTRHKKGVKDKSIKLAEVISTIGHTLRGILKLKRDSAIAARTGAFILYSFEELGVLNISMGAGENGHGVYIINILNDDILSKLWESVTINKTEKLPSEKPYEPWETVKHSTGLKMIKTYDANVLNVVTKDTHPILFDVLNKAQTVGWRINQDVYDLHLWALRNKTDAFSDIWEQTNPDAKQSKIREAIAIGEIAKRFIGKTFYQLYYYDFRGRKYCTTAYLHEQGSDLARGLLLRDGKKRIGDQGFFWLLISIANNWGGDCGREDGAKSDKIPLNDRVYWALDNEEILISYAENPKVNQGWMKADSPWQFLAAVLELKNLRDWQESESLQSCNYDEYGYESHLEAYVDGSNNGSQHLSALTKDEVTAPYVNLVPLELPGDLYTYVGEHVWATLQQEVDKLTPEEITDCNRVIDTLADYKSIAVASLDKSEIRTEYMEKTNAYRKENQEIIDIAAPVFWNRIIDIKQRRKIIKRNVMTLPYGGTAYGLGQQVIDDSKKHGIAQLLGLEHKWGSYLGRMILEDCKISLERPMRLLSVFENAGKQAEKDGRFLSWNVPITKFPVVQHYVEGTTRKIHVAYGPKTGKVLPSKYYANDLQLHICFIEDTKMKKRKQAQGASPNAIHSLDAAHLMLTVSKANFNVTTIHDSFGCLLGDMPELFILLRETFAELYSAEPLKELMEQIQGDISQIEIGTLDINSIIESEYAFA